MGFDSPIISALVARLPEAKENLAAFGVAFALGLIIESPIINLLSAVAALCKSKRSFLISKRFSFILVWLVVLTQLMVLIPSVFNFLALNLIGLDARVAELTYLASWHLAIWPPVIGIRRFYQGVMVAAGSTKKIAYGTVVRIVSTLVATIFFVNTGYLQGAAAGCSSLSLGASLEALFIYFASLPSQRKFCKKVDATDDLTMKKLRSYYFPLAQTSFLGLAFQPMLTFFIARSINPLVSLAAFPVANGFAFLFRTLGLSITEVYLVYFKNGPLHVAALKRITVILIMMTTFIYLALSFTPAAHFVVAQVMGVKGDVASLAVYTIKIFVPIVGGTIILSYYRAKIMTWSKTYHLSRGTFIEVLSACALVWFFVELLQWNGAISAALSIVISRYIQIGFLITIIAYEKKLGLAKPDDMSSA